MNETPTNVIDDSALSPEQVANIESIKSAAFQAGYLQHQKDQENREIQNKELSQSVKKFIKQAFANGIKEGMKSTEQVSTNAQPYEIVSDVGIKYSAKGEAQPEASVKITRHLEDGNSIADLIKADLARGVEEMMIAVAEIQKRNVKI